MDGRWSHLFSRAHRESPWIGRCENNSILEKAPLRTRVCSYTGKLKKHIRCADNLSARTMHCGSNGSKAVSIVAISDTHNYLHEELPPGDVLIHAGDLTEMGRHSEVKAYLEWFRRQRHRHKIMIAGNHDMSLDADYHRFNQKTLQLVLEAQEDITYLHNSAAQVDGIKIYGSPYTPAYGGFGFALADDEQAQACWASIPPDTDVVVSHGPPHGVLDLCNSGVRAGCPHLMSRIRQVQPQIHIFGHIHEGYGQEQHGRTLFVNASTMDCWKQPLNKPVRLTAMAPGGVAVE